MRVGTKMKGIILAGGFGTRLYPLTKVLSKHLLPVYDKPLIYYSLSVLMLAGIRDILIISTPQDIPRYRELLGAGTQLGLSFKYAAQDKPSGLPEAFIIGEKFIGKENVALILGDNIFYGQTLSKILRDAVTVQRGATIFGIYTKNPKPFGVIEFDKKGNVIAIEEKPKKPKSNFVVPGLYFYDNDVIAMAKQLKISPRGELEISELNEMYLKKGKLNVKLFGRGMAWFDSGTHDSLLEAAHFIATIQNRQGLYIACIEEIAFNSGYINARQLRSLAHGLRNTDYGKYLLTLATEKIN
jgi:glucose-1-phosphate thymidylyltransferase